MQTDKNILVIDDEFYVCKSIQKILASEEVSADFSLTGQEGITKARENSYDLIIIDVQMPEVNGFEVARTIKRISPASHVIIMSGYNTPNTKDKAEECGAIDFVAKPFTPEEMLDAVKHAFSGQHSAPTTPQLETVVGEAAAPAATSSTPVRIPNLRRDQKKAVAYVCPVVLDYADDVIGIDEQKKKIIKFAMRNKLDIVAFYEDEQQSENLMAQPALREILNSETEAGVFLIERVWTLARKRVILRPFLEALEAGGFKLETATTLMDCVSMYARHWDKNKNLPLPVTEAEAQAQGVCGAQPGAACEG